MTPKLGHKPIAMRHCAEISEVKAVGDFCWLIGQTGKRALWLAMPASTAQGWAYSRWTIDYPNAQGAQWSWDGNETAPTLNPSLHAVGYWHGWVRNGQLIEA